MTEITAGRGLTGWHILAVFLAFFGIIIAVNVYFSVVAVRSWTGVVVEDSYASGQDFNEKVQRAEKQAALGWTSKLNYGSGNVRFELRDRSGAMLAASRVTASATRPLGDRDDRTITLAPLADGAFAAELTLPKGTWNVVTVASGTSQGDFERRDQIVVP